ncbi:hypothetical protein H257_11485 [Aphanomyces astaci]|uniref:Glucokinase n=1 Tax=Aphanomyces astaci TaxID=112090 RepID=W4G439_APHAT|nr:hypothetical protein H257_11485 [Aphanomyces astaci]ETV73804.1 hypothetical protein H257_11485 [Aphanomyces astaci]|eukprot:XP_009836740.1 hypothetical protein H257_11485 [Aphanomyces astaci]
MATTTSSVPATPSEIATTREASSLSISPAPITIMRHYIGVDIGGTSVKCGVVSSEGVLLSRNQRKIEDDRSSDVVVGLCIAIVKECVEEAGISWSHIAGLGVGCPGQASNGVLVAAANFETWKDVALERLLNESLHIPCTLVNDADAAVAAEHWVGTASKVKNFIMLTLGTGIGFGVVNDNAILAGGTGMIEGGHVIVVPNGRACGCTQKGCLERYSSATALIQQAKLKATDKSLNTKLSDLKIDEITAKQVFETAATGDSVAKELIAEAADYLGFACVNFCRILDPELIVLSGGLAENGEYFIQAIRDAYTKYTWTKLPNPVRIEKASVGYDSGIIGAAAFAFKKKAEV